MRAAFAREVGAGGYDCRCTAMRIALVSPVFVDVPGGRDAAHRGAGRAASRRRGHDVRVLAPYDPDDRLAARLHRGARPAGRAAPDYLVPLGRTIGFPMNGAVSNLALTPYAISTLRRELAAGATTSSMCTSPSRRWSAGTRLVLARCRSSAPSTATPRTASPTTIANLLGARRRAQPPARADRRLRGGGVDGPALLRRALPGHPQRRRRARAAPAGPKPRRDPLRIALRRPGRGAQGPARAAARLRGAARRIVPRAADVVGAEPEEVAPCCSTTRGVTRSGKVDDDDEARAAARGRRARARRRWAARASAWC